MGFEVCVRSCSKRRQKFSSAAAFCAENMEICNVKNKKAVPKKDVLIGSFGKYFSDHMLIAEWSRDKGWISQPRLDEFKNFEISPAASSLHYALQCFEGMKAYRGDDNKIRLFRPELNGERLNRSLRRLEMPEIPTDQFIKAISQLVNIDQRFIPDGNGYSAYLRPTAIATDAFLGVGPAASIRFFCILSPVGPYFPSGFSAITVAAETDFIRAWPGGAGNCKIGGNYATTVHPQTIAANQSAAQQVLYCTPDIFEGEKRYRVTEVGSMNFFVVLSNGDKFQLVTPPLEPLNDILPGVTRRSIIELAQNYPDVSVSDSRHFYLDELVKASQDGRILEIFGAGTAATICPIKSIISKQFPTIVPTGEKVQDDLGPIASRLLTDLNNMYYGRGGSRPDWTTIVS